MPSLDIMLINNALVVKSKSDWIVDSGTTCHMCNDRAMFTEFKQLSSSGQVALGDGSSFDVAGEGTVDMDMLLTDGIGRVCAPKNVLYVPKLANCLVSVPRAAQAGKTAHFDDSTCEFQNEIVALGIRHGSLYYLEIA